MHGLLIRHKLTRLPRAILATHRPLSIPSIPFSLVHMYLGYTYPWKVVLQTLIKNLYVLNELLLKCDIFDPLGTQLRHHLRKMNFSDAQVTDRESST